MLAFVSNIKHMLVFRK